MFHDCLTCSRTTARPTRQSNSRAYCRCDGAESRCEYHLRLAVAQTQRRSSAMPTGIVLFPDPQATNRVDDAVAQAARAYELGVRQVWLSQNNDHDAIALAAVIGAA